MNMVNVTQSVSVTNLCPQDREVRCIAGALVEFQHFPQRKIPADISVHHKEELRVPAEYLVPEMEHAPRCTQGAVLLKVSEGWQKSTHLSAKSVPCHHHHAE